MRLSLSPLSSSPLLPRSRDGLYGLICGDVKIAKINTELLTLNIRTIDWAGPCQTLVVRGPSATFSPMMKGIKN